MPPSCSRRAFLAGSLGFAALLVTGCGPRDQPLTGVPSTAEYPATGLLVDPAWVAEHLNDPFLRLIDCSPIRVYRRGHLPGARHVWWQDTIEVNNPVYGMLTGHEGRRRLMQEAGINPDSSVVCYDDRGGQYAARIVWMLHAMNFDRVRLLDGGVHAWSTSGRELSRGTPAINDGSLVGTPNEEVLAHGHDIAAGLGRPGVVVLDTRTRDERAETWYGRLRRGAIPGSRWLPRDQFLSAPGSPFLAAPDELTLRLADAGVSLDTPEIIVYGLHSERDTYGSMTAPGRNGELATTGRSSPWVLNQAHRGSETPGSR
jgi:thiosulfate/3-mercaptopyruvate sulfurtransferase